MGYFVKDVWYKDGLVKHDRTVTVHLIRVRALSEAIDRLCALFGDR